MKGSMKRKVLTSGRMTGGGPTVQQARKRATIPGQKEPACSFYSTDPQEQVASLHSGLDRCADLLSSMLQVDKAGVNNSPAKVKPANTQGRRPTKKFLPVTGIKNTQTLPHSNLLPTLKEPLHGSTHSKPLTSVLLSVTQHESSQHSALTSSQRARRQTACQPVGSYRKAPLNAEDVDSVPVKDTDPKNDTGSRVHAYDKKIEQPCDMQSGEDINIGKLRTVHYLLGELKSLIAGKGSVAERLLSHLEVTVSSPQLNSNHLDLEKPTGIQALHSQNDQLHRQVAFLNKQLEMEKKLNSETLMETLPEDLASAQFRLQELQVILAEVRTSLMHTKKQLVDREAENVLMKSDLETLRTKFMQSELVNSELASLAQQRLEQIEYLERTIKNGNNVPQCHTVVDLARSDAALKDQDDQRNTSEHITKFLLDLGQSEVSPINGKVQMVAEREDGALEKAKMSSTFLGNLQTYPYNHFNQSRSDVSEGVQMSEEQMVKERRRLFDSFLSEGKVDAFSPDCSMRSMSTIDTRDEAAFRDGLAALDASIASLQKTIKQDLAR
ncbi:uncharacterized protein ccdc14 isoform X2 [Stigmatopora nigra]